MATEKQQPKKQRKRLAPKDVMDGAFFPGEKTKTPADFMDDPRGFRPGQTKKPWGTVLIDLTDGTSGLTLPPRFIWDKGHWRGTLVDDWDVWVVSGEGTPGNYEERHYRLPDKIAEMMEPEHPADWPETHKKHSGKGKKKKSKGNTDAETTSSWGSWGKGQKGAGLPFGLKVRCVGCGHFFKMDDLPDHAKNACPVVQDPVMWAIECECHRGNILATIEPLPGFPQKPPEKPPEEPASDMSGAGDLAETMKNEAAAKPEAASNPVDSKPESLKALEGD